LLQSNLVRNVADPASSGSERFGEFQIHEEKSGQIEVGGHAFLPDKQGPADAVLIIYDNAEGEPVICAIVSLRSRANPGCGPRGILPRCCPDGGESFPKIVFLKDNSVF
jgi:hypothetical protein